MSNHSILRIAGIAGILSAILMLATTFAVDPSNGMSPAFAIPAAALGIVYVAGLYLLYRGEASALSLLATAASVIGYLLFLVASLTQAKFPSPVLSAADILVYIVGMALFSWLAFSSHKMPRLLPIVGFVGALAGVISYVLMSVTGANIENPGPLLSVVYFIYLVAVVVWLAWTGISLLRMKS